MNDKVLVIGVGEIGKPLLELIQPHYEAYGLDIKPAADIPQCDIMHLCFPFFETDSFVKESVRYIKQYQPALVIVNSTVSPGTTRRISTESGVPAVNSPVLGKHARMKQEMLEYTKTIGPVTAEAGELAAAHFKKIGMKVRIYSSPEASEIAKLTETTYFGVLISWAQEVERYCKEFGVNYEEAITFYEEIKYLPRVKFYPGTIGGHCVLPNIKILKRHFKSGILDAIEKSNELKVKNLGADGWNK